MKSEPDRLDFLIVLLPVILIGLLGFQVYQYLQVDHDLVLEPVTASGPAPEEAPAEEAEAEPLPAEDEAVEGAPTPEAGGEEVAEVTTDAPDAEAGPPGEGEPTEEARTAEAGPEVEGEGPPPAEGDTEIAQPVGDAEVDPSTPPAGDSPVQPAAAAGLTPAVEGAPAPLGQGVPAGGDAPPPSGGGSEMTPEQGTVAAQPSPSPGATGAPEGDPAGSGPEAAGTGSEATVDPASPARVTGVPRVNPATVDNLVAVDILIENASEVSGVIFHLRFDPAVVEYAQHPPAELGPFLNDEGGRSRFVSQPTPGGKIVVAVSRPGVLEPRSGVGVLATFHFLAVGAGTSKFEFVQASIRGASNQVLPATFEEFTLDVRH